MPRPMLVGLVTMMGVACASAAWATPTMSIRTPETISALPVQYSACPPGYKITSHGGCKLSHYLRHHPALNPNNYYVRPERRYHYGYDRPRYRDYDNNDYDDNNDYGDGD